MLWGHLEVSNCFHIPVSFLMRYLAGTLWSYSLENDLDGGWGSSTPFFNRYMVFYVYVMASVSGCCLFFMEFVGVRFSVCWESCILSLFRIG